MLFPLPKRWVCTHRRVQRVNGKHALLCSVHMLSLAKQRAVLWSWPWRCTSALHSSFSLKRRAVARLPAARLLFASSEKARTVSNLKLLLWQSCTGSLGGSIQIFLIYYSVLCIILKINEKFFFLWVPNKEKLDAPIMFLLQHIFDAAGETLLV